MIKQITADNAAGDSLPAYLFHQGTNFTAYDYLGVHGTKTDRGFCYTFRVWAPNAESVSLNSDFTDWQSGYTLARVTDGGVWETVIETDEALTGRYYKYAIKGHDGAYINESIIKCFFSNNELLSGWAKINLIPSVDIYSTTFLSVFFFGI